jgi:hypothetical protein
MRRMAIGKRKRDRQPSMWVTTTDLRTAASHPFYQRLNQMLREHAWDSHLHQRARLRAAVVDRSRSRTRRGLRKSTTDPRRPRETPPPETRRIARATVCSSLRDRWLATGTRARTGERAEAVTLHASAFNLGLWMRTLFGIGTPRALQGRLAVFVAVLNALRSLTLKVIVQRWRHSFLPIPSEQPRNGFIGCA